MVRLGTFSIASLGINNFAEVLMTEQDEGHIRRIRIWGLVFLLAPILFAAIWCISRPDHFYTWFVFQNYVTFFILPYGALFAYYLVLTLEHSRGPIEFEVTGLKFKGAAGPIIFWILIFLAFVLALQFLWHEPKLPSYMVK